MSLDRRGLPGSASSWEAPIAAMKQRVSNPRAALEAIAREVIEGPTGAIAVHYADSGLKQRTGLSFQAMTTRGAPSHYMNIFGNTIKVGVSIEAYQYKEGTYGAGGGRISLPMLLGILLFGHKEIRPRMRKVLRWTDAGGNVHFAKRVPSAPGHNIFFLSSGDLQKARQVAARVIMEGA